MIVTYAFIFFFFFSSRRRHTRFDCDWSSDVCSSDLSHDCPDCGSRVQGTGFSPCFSCSIKRGNVKRQQSAQHMLVTQQARSEEHTSDSSHSQISYAVFCLKKKKKIQDRLHTSLSNRTAQMYDT